MMPSERLTRAKALKWGKWIGIDDDGSARVFKKKPVKIGSTWVSDEFPGKMYPACYRLEDDYKDHLHGCLLRRDTKNGEKFFRRSAENDT